MNSITLGVRCRSVVQMVVAVLMLAFACLTAVTPVEINAQGTGGGSNCTTSPAPIQNARDVCQKARDIFAFVAPQVGLALSGGNPIPGDAGSLGGFGKRAISLRLVAVEGQLPRNRVPLSYTSSAVNSSDFGAERVPLPLPSVDVAIGVFPGVPLGLTNAFGLDVLGGVTYLPAVSRGSFNVEPKNGGFGYSLGARVGLLQESSIVPGVGVSWQRRKLPNAEFSYTPGNDSLTVTGTSVHSDALRAVISKRFVFAGFAVGVGQDRIEAASNVQAVVNETIGGVNQRGTGSLTGLRETTKRNTAFVNASVGVLIFRVVGEYGWSDKGEVRETINRFGSRTASDGYRYASLGITAHF